MNSPIEVNDRVQWIQTRKTGRSVHLSKREGKVIEIFPSKIVDIKLRNGRVSSVHLSRLSRIQEIA